MAYDPSKHHRRSIRLRGYDYAGGGAYFITICTHNKECLFGKIIEGEMVANAVGRIVYDTWKALPRRFVSLVLDAFQIMPNHLHAVFVLPGPGLEPALANAVGARVIQPSATGRERACPPLLGKGKDETRGDGKPSPYDEKERPDLCSTNRRTSMGDVVGGLKSISTIAVNKLMARTGTRLLHENFYEHIIRNLDELQIIRDYIIHNPQRWLEDPENPNHE